MSEPNKTERRDRVTKWFERQTARIGRAGAWLTLLASALAVTAGVLGLFTLSLRSDVSHLNGQIDELTQLVDNANSQLESRAETIEQLRAENSDLRRLVPPQIDPNDVHPIRAAGVVRLARDGDSIDLNSIAVNFDAGPNMYIADSLRYDGEQLVTLFGIDYVVLDTGPANYESCALATGYQGERQLDLFMMQSENVCLRLDSGRFAKVVVTAQDGEFAELAITVWN